MEFTESHYGLLFEVGLLLFLNSGFIMYAMNVTFCISFTLYAVLHLKFKLNFYCFVIY